MPGEAAPCPPPSSPHRPTTADAQPRIGLALGTALYVASVLGTGILLLPTLAARAAGPASLVAVAAVLLASVPLAAAFAALATRHPDSGGVATYVRLALGPTAARMTGYWFFFGVCVGAPVVALLGAQYVVAMLGGAQWHVYLVGAAFLVPPLVTNAVGLRLAGPVQLALTGALVVLVVGVVLVSLPAADPANLVPFAPHGWAGVGAAASLYVWAFAGWEAVTHLAGEFRDPRRTIPRATAIALVVVGVAYLALQYVDGDRPRRPCRVVGRPADGPGRRRAARSRPGRGGRRRRASSRSACSAPTSAPSPSSVRRSAATATCRAGWPEARSRAACRVARCSSSPPWPPLYFAIAVATGGELEPFVLVHTSCMVAIYAVGMAAAVRLLDRGSAGWWAAVVACVLSLGLAALAGWHLVVPLGLALVAVAVGGAAAGPGCPPQRVTSRRLRPQIVVELAFRSVRNR